MREARAPQSLARALAGRAARLLMVLASYYVFARLGLLLAFAHSNVTPVWPASGVAVASLLTFGDEVWLGIAAGSLLANLTTGLQLPVSIGLMTGNTCEYLLAAHLLRRAGVRPTFDRPTDVVGLAALGMLSSLVAATVGTASLRLDGQISIAEVLKVWTTYWIGDGIGIVVVAPAVLVFSRLRPQAVRPASVIEAAALALSVVVSGAIVFLGDFPNFYLLFTFAIWAALRFRQVGATGTALVISGLAILGTINGEGPFSAGDVTGRLVSLELYVASFVLTAMVLAAVVGTLAESESALRGRTRELEEANQELEAFSYTVAHDLRAPLRAINGYSEVLLDRSETALAADGRRYLASISTNARHMGRLIDALLNLARVGRVELDAHAVDPARLARAAVQRLCPGDQEPCPDISVAEAPPCRADPALLGQVYENLIDNAIKATAHREPSRIEIGCLTSGADRDAPVYFVRDNGVGFDMRYADKLFGVFERLHRDDEFPGTGAGLAIVRRIVQRHGGQVWADAEPGAGATFFFTVGEGDDGLGAAG